MWSTQDNDQINEHEILSGRSLEYFVQRRYLTSPWFMLMPDAANKAAPLIVEIRQIKELLCFGECGV